MRYPIGVQSFETIINEDYYYVDKTDLVYELAQENVCTLVRPRRFGKSLLVSTLDAYFSGQKELFKGLKIDELEKDWIKYPVFRLDFSGGDYTNPDKLNQIIKWNLNEWENQYNLSSGKDIPIGMRFKYVIDEAYKQTGKKAVVLIDNCDKPIVDVLGSETEILNRNTLNGFLGTFKAADASLRFVFVTGTLKFVHEYFSTSFNQARDISMNSKFDAICGITQDELYEVFAEPIKELANKLKLSIEETKQLLKKQYGGYHFSEELLDIYNPHSLLNAYNNCKLDNYWLNTIDLAYINRILDINKIDINKIRSLEYSGNYLNNCDFYNKNYVSFLYQIGFLTIKEHKLYYFNSEYTLDFPNDEVRNAFSTLVSNE